MSTHALCPRCGHLVQLADGGTLVAHVAQLAPKLGRRGSGPTHKARKCEGSGLRPADPDPRRS